QLGIEQGLVAGAADAEVDADDAVGDLADTAEVLPLDAGGLGARLEGGGLIDQADGAQVVGSHGGQVGGDVALQLLADVGVSPEVVLEELLQGADGAAGGQGDGLDALAGQVREQALAVGVQVGEGLG